jgi:hypothetical protein
MSGLLWASESLVLPTLQAKSDLFSPPLLHVLRHRGGCQDDLTELLLGPWICLRKG